MSACPRNCTQRASTVGSAFSIGVSRTLGAIGVAIAIWSASGCGDEAPAPIPAPIPAARPLPETAHPKQFAHLRALRDRVRHPADGAGRAWVERSAGQLAYAISATADRFEIVFQAGPLGIAPGGAILFQLPQIGGWSIPQADRPEARGYTVIEASEPDLALDVIAPDGADDPLRGTKSLVIRVSGRAMRADEQIRIRYGAGPGLALPDRYAEREARFWIGVDGDGDQSFGYLVASPTIEVRAGPPAQLVASVSSVSAPGEPARVTLALLDAHRNAVGTSPGEIALRSVPPGLRFPDPVGFETGSTHFEVSAGEPGVYHIHAALGRFRAISNPLVVSEDAAPIYWGDLHGHSGVSDGTGSPDEYFRYARDTAGLDIVGLTDHDHLGVLKLDESPERWNEIRQSVHRFHQPDRFVALLGFEWTSWIHGHRHVLYFDDPGAEGGSPAKDELFSAMDPSFATPELLWSALGRSRRSALTFAHHSAGGPIATDWSVPPDPQFEPVTEITSVHGSSEAPDASFVIEKPVAGNFVRDALGRGYRLGFVGSGDTHDGHPGVTQIGYRTGGLAAIVADRLTRQSVLAALRDRRVYATSGSRIVLRADLAGRPMGSRFAVPIATGAPVRLRVRGVGTAPIERVDLVGPAGVIESIAGSGSAAFDIERSPIEMRPGGYLYVRVVQTDGATAWSSPFFFEAR